MFPQSPHAISELRDILNEYKREQYLLQRADAEKSADRIIQLGHLIKDIELAIGVLEKQFSLNELTTAEGIQLGLEQALDYAKGDKTKAKSRTVSIPDAETSVSTEKINH